MIETAAGGFYYLFFMFIAPDKQKIQELTCFKQAVVCESWQVSYEYSSSVVLRVEVVRRNVPKCTFLLAILESTSY